MSKNSDLLNLVIVTNAEFLKIIIVHNAGARWGCACVRVRVCVCDFIPAGLFCETSRFIDDRSTDQTTFRPFSHLRGKLSLRMDLRAFVKEGLRARQYALGHSQSYQVPTRLEPLAK